MAKKDLLDEDDYFLTESKEETDEDEEVDDDDYAEFRDWEEEDYLVIRFHS